MLLFRILYMLLTGIFLLTDSYHGYAAVVSSPTEADSNIRIEVNLQKNKLIVFIDDVQHKEYPIARTITPIILPAGHNLA